MWPDFDSLAYNKLSDSRTLCYCSAGFYHCLRIKNEKFLNQASDDLGSAVAQEADVRAALLNLESFLIEEDPTVPKVDLNVILAEALEDGKAMPATNELREHCHNVMSAGG